MKPSHPAGFRPVGAAPGLTRSPGADIAGLPTAAIENGCLRLEYLLRAGPRLVRLFAAGRSENLLAETPGASWETPFGRYHLYGGHRLWHAPESSPRSSIPDDDGLQVAALPGGVRLERPAEAPTGIAKTLEVRLDPNRPIVRLAHRLVNCSLWPVELAPWAITQLPLGGIAVLPAGPGSPLPASPAGGPNRLPDRQLVLWPYAQWNDSRLRLRSDYVFLEGQARRDPFKIGSFIQAGWLGYFWKGVFFQKRFSPEPGRPHPDLGCNAEIYTESACLELETLGPLVALEPGQSVEHVETWEIYTGLGRPQTPAECEAILAGLEAV